MIKAGREGESIEVLVRRSTRKILDTVIESESDRTLSSMRKKGGEG